jgi:hypothetical protein
MITLVKNLTEDNQEIRQNDEIHRLLEQLLAAFQQK